MSFCLHRQSAKIVPNKIAQKLFTKFFLEIFGFETFVKIYLILPEIVKGGGGYWVPETLVEQSKTQNEHGSGTQIVMP
jgi:hypothetical protein